MKTRTLITAAALLAASSASAQSYIMQVVLNDGTIHSFDVADVKEVTWSEPEQSFNPEVIGLPDMNITRISAFIIVNGDSYYVAGGRTDGFYTTGCVDLYSDGAWTSVSQNVYHDACSLVTLKDGRKLLIGGLGSSFGVGQSNAVHVFDPAQGTFSQVSSLNHARALTHSATLESGKVLVVGNWYADASSAELFDPATETFTLVGGVTRETGNCMVFPTKDGGAAVISTTDNYGYSNWNGYYTKYNAESNSFVDYEAEGLSGLKPVSVEDNFVTEYSLTHDSRNLFMAFDQDGNLVIASFNQETEKFENLLPLSTKDTELGSNATYRSSLIVNKDKHLLHTFLVANGDPRFEVRTYNYDNGALVGSFLVDNGVCWWGSATALLPDGNIIVAGGSPYENNFTGSAAACIIKPM